MTPTGKFRTALIVCLAVWGGIEWYTERDDNRVEDCREVGIESQARLDRCRESSAAMREEIEAEKEAQQREKRRQVLQRFADARQELDHLTTYGQEAAKSDGDLGDLMRAAGLKGLDFMFHTDEHDPSEIERTATIQTRLSAGYGEDRNGYSIEWRQQPRESAQLDRSDFDDKADYMDAEVDRMMKEGEDDFFFIEADISRLSKPERDLVQAACDQAFSSVIYGTLGCPVVIHGKLVARNDFATSQNQLASEDGMNDFPFRTVVFEIDRIRFKEPPERVNGIKLYDQ